MVSTTVDGGAATRLAVYGTLAPGRANHRQLASLEGRWTSGLVHGRLLPSGWGSALGYRGLVLDPEAEAVPVLLFECADLPKEWARLDEFEGPDYQRVVVSVVTAEGRRAANIYTLTGR